MEFFREVPFFAYFFSLILGCGSLLLSACGSSQMRGGQNYFPFKQEELKKENAGERSVSAARSATDSEATQKATTQVSPSDQAHQIHQAHQAESPSRLPGPGRFWASDPYPSPIQTDISPASQAQVHTSALPSQSLPPNLLERATVRDWRWELSDRKMPLVESLEMRCPDGFDYGKPRKPKIPRVSCQFVAPIDNESYLCEFEFQGKALPLKVVKDGPATRSAVAANELARMLGFAHATNCPAVVECDGCDQNLNGRFAKADSVVQMGYAGKKASPQSISWKALNRANGNGFAEGMEVTLIEREAYILWQSFLRTASGENAQADFQFNLICDQNCEKVLVVAEDPTLLHGLPIEGWLKQKVFHDPKTCQVRGLAGINTVSEEARKWLLDHMRTVSRANLQDLFSLARFPEATGTPALWATGFFEKANQLAEVGREGESCSPLAQERTVLGQPLPSR